jgi:hypothetical protein
MPYIIQDRRDALARGARMRTPGELNYEFTRELLNYLSTNGLSYGTINDIIGALEGAKAEFQRRVVGPYENFKRFQNGDVYHQIGDVKDMLRDLE